MQKLEEKYIDAFTEMVNIGVGQAADTLNQITKSHIVLHVPVVKIIELCHLQKELQLLVEENHAAINLNFTKDLNGTAKLIFPTSSATKLVKLFVGSFDDSYEDTILDDLRISALTEIGNVIINTIIGTISNELGIDIAYTVPEFREGEIDEVVEDKNNEANFMILLCQANFKADEVDISGSLIIYFNIDRFNEFINILDVYYKRISIS